MNTLYYGNNLDILRTYIKDECVDLIYLDPPFNSNRQLQRPIQKRERRRGRVADNGVRRHSGVGAASNG